MTGNARLEKVGGLAGYIHMIQSETVRVWLVMSDGASLGARVSIDNDFRPLAAGRERKKSKIPIGADGHMGGSLLFAC